MVKLAHEDGPPHGVHLLRRQPQTFRLVPQCLPVGLSPVGELVIRIAHGHGTPVAAKDVPLSVDDGRTVVCVHGFQQKGRVKIGRIVQDLLPACGFVMVTAFVFKPVFRIFLKGRFGQM